MIHEREQLQRGRIGVAGNEEENMTEESACHFVLTLATTAEEMKQSEVIPNLKVH